MKNVSMYSKTFMPQHEAELRHQDKNVLNEDKKRKTAAGGGISFQTGEI